MRWRGAMNGGSDSMNLVVALPLAIALTLRTPVAQAVAFGYITLQTTLSYFVAGCVKIREAEWRSGSALPIFLCTPQYGAPVWLQHTLQASPALSRGASWGVMLFELSFPLAFTAPPFTLAFLVGAFCFHLINAYILGLNRFVFAWVSAYPAVLFVSQLIHYRLQL